MKKTAIILLLATALATFASCGSDTPSDTSADQTTAATTTAVTTSPIIVDDRNPSSSTNVEHTVKLNQDLTSLKTVVEASDPTTMEFEGYTAETTGAEWQINSGIDYSLYDFLGTGSDLMNHIKDEKNTTYNRYVQDNKVAYYRVRYENGEFVYKKLGENAVSQTKALGAKIQVNTKLGRLLVYYQEIELRTSLDYSSVTGDNGAFLRFSFHTNLPATYKVNISSRKNDDGNGIIVCENIVPRKSDDGSYVGAGQMTIPYVDGEGNPYVGEYYVNVISGGKCLGFAPIQINKAEDPRNPNLHLQLTGDWDAITAEGYKESLINLFYNTYPRLYQRWATNGNEPTTITFVSDPTYDGVAYCMGTKVVVSTAYANSNPADIGFFSHEITHWVQQFNFYYGDGAWFTENMANYGGFRYHHWADGKYVQLYKDANQNDLYNWNWGAYGDGSKWFFAYLDYNWPTTLDANGNKVRGLLDTLVYEIKHGSLVGGNDNATNKNSPFNKIVKEITGFDCIEDVRAQYEKDFRSKAWDFKGFGEYTDNFLTENVPYVQNPNYPMVTEKNPGDKTATALETAVTEGDNLALGATVYKISGSVKAAEDGNKLVDGKLDSKWCSSAASVKDKTYSLDGTRQWIVLDLGEKKTFNTYTIYNTRTQETYANMTEWEILVSDDAVNWTSVDYQPDCNQDLVSFNVGSQSARYVMIKGYTVDKSNGVGTIRLYEFQLYNQ